MALDGAMIFSIVKELNTSIINGKIDKIHQPEKDELVVAIRSKTGNKKLFISAHATNNRVCFIEERKKNPKTAPMFCMILRKYVLGGKIISVEQYDFDRIIIFTIESYNDFGDLSLKKLIVELMGKHSNIILINDKGIILDSIKRVGLDKSYVRQILPKNNYVFPPNKKVNPFSINEKTFNYLLLQNKNLSVYDFLIQSFSGISYMLSTEVCFFSSIEPSVLCNDIFKNNLNSNFYTGLKSLLHLITNDYKHFTIFLKDEKLKEFTNLPIKSYKYTSSKAFSTSSELLHYYYIKKDIQLRMEQKTLDLRKIVSIHMERCKKKIKKQEKTLTDAENRNMYRLHGELILSNLHNIQKGDDVLITPNYYLENSEDIKIKLDKNITPNENAQKLFSKYNKFKRAVIATTSQLKTSKLELIHLESVKSSIEISEDEDDINDIRTELSELGLVKKKYSNKKSKTGKSKPHHFISTNGFNMFVGKNNKQNDIITLKNASKSDIWFHTKNIPGSHVIVSTKGLELDELTILEASTLAGFYSKGRNSSKIAIDYTAVKNVKKPNGAKPGMVIYKTNNTYYVTPKEEFILNLEKK